METARAILVTGMCGGIAAILASALWRGLRTGKMPHSDSRATFDRKSQPVQFWLTAILFMAMLLIIAAGWALAISNT